MNKNFLLFFLLFHAVAFLAAQEDSLPKNQEIIYDTQDRKPVEFDEDYLEELKQQPEFNYVEATPPDNWWTQFKTWINKLWSSFWEWLLGGLEAGAILSFILEILPYLILLGVFLLFVWLFAKYDFGGKMLKKKPQPGVFLNEDEKIIQSENIEQLIAEAKANKNYRLSIRYYFLLTLKNLSEKEIIKFKAEKTNQDYQLEIKDSKQRVQFRSLSHIYDFIWYGDFSVSENDFLKAEKQFLNMQRELKTQENG